MEYKIIFEIAQTGIGELTFILPGILFIIIGIFLVKFRHHIAKTRSKRFTNVFSFFFLGFAIIWTLVDGLSINSQQSTLRKCYEEGSFKIVEI